MKPIVVRASRGVSTDTVLLCGTDRGGRRPENGTYPRFWGKYERNCLSSVCVRQNPYSSTDSHNIGTFAANKLPQSAAAPPRLREGCYCVRLSFRMGGVGGLY